MRVAFFIATAVLLPSLRAQAQDSVRTEDAGGPRTTDDAFDVEPETGAPPPLDRWDLAAWDHFELSMGFIAGVRRYDHAAFTLDDTDAPVHAGAIDLAEPFEDEPFDRLTTMGLRYDARLVAAYTRMTVGIDIPFAHYRPTQARASYDVGGTAREVILRDVSPFLLHFGIGGEIPIGPIAPFIDVLGHLRWTTVTLGIDGVDHTYREHGFGFSARAGLRLHVRRWFYASLAGELGIVGDTRWGTELSVGFAMM